jgi:hypothetical protein
MSINDLPLDVLLLILEHNLSENERIMWGAPSGIYSGKITASLYIAANNIK